MGLGWPSARMRAELPECGVLLRACIESINVYLLGWLGFFGICTAGVERTFSGLDAHIRRRLRAIQLQHWKRRRTITLKLVALGVSRKMAWRTVYNGRKSTWALAHTTATHRGLRNAYFAERGLVSLVDHWKARSQHVVAPMQLALALG